MQESTRSNSHRERRPPAKRGGHGSIIAFGVLALALALAFAVVGYRLGQLSLTGTNRIEGSQSFGGYSPVGLHMAFDKQTGVCYAVSDTGQISPLYKATGELKTVS